MTQKSDGSRAHLTGRTNHKVASWLADRLTSSGYRVWIDVSVNGASTMESRTFFLALPYPALPCPALPCPALLCPALLCPALPCSALP